MNDTTKPTKRTFKSIEHYAATRDYPYVNQFDGPLDLDRVTKTCLGWGQTIVE